MDYDKVHKKALEVNAYHRLGFYIIDGTIYELDRGHKSEVRDATDIEMYLWETRFLSTTPELPVYTVDDKDDVSLVPLFLKNLELPAIWVDNKYGEALFSYSNHGWELIYHNIKLLREE
jgi:hypothetical protein